MKPIFFLKRFISVVLLSSFAVLAPYPAAAMSFGRIVVFGTSLSDPGNAFALKGGVNTPPYDDPAKMDLTFLIPDVPYARGGHHFTNGATWVEQFSRGLGLAGNTRPAFESSSAEATNYAVGGARAYDDGINFNLSRQVNAFLNVFGEAPSDALYVIEFGGNDIRDALAFGNAAIIGDALTAIGNNIALLYGNGARRFLIWNAPDVGLTPAVRSLGPIAMYYAGLLTDSFNANLDALVGALSTLPGIDIRILDAHRTLKDLVGPPPAFGLTVVDAACIMPGDPPFTCQTPDEYLFWDGIHPTTTVHALIARDAAAALAPPVKGP